MTLGPMHGPGQPAGPRLRMDDEGRDRLATRTLSLPTAADTHELGHRLAAVLRRGDLVILNGPLGAGKTVLVQGIGAGLAVQGRVVSPTFVIARIHPPGPGGVLTLVHVDAYRLESLAEVDDLDLDVEAGSVVTVVEWGAGKVEQLAEARLEVELARSVESEERTATLRPHGGDWADRVRGMTGDAGN